jgi:hypothetical protein
MVSSSRWTDYPTVYNTIEISDEEWNEIWDSFFRYCTDTTKPYDPERKFKPFSQYLRELIALKLAGEKR